MSLCEILNFIILIDQVTECHESGRNESGGGTL